MPEKMMFFGEIYTTDTNFTRRKLTNLTSEFQLIIQPLSISISSFRCRKSCSIFSRMRRQLKLIICCSDNPGIPKVKYNLAKCTSPCSSWNNSDISNWTSKLPIPIELPESFLWCLLIISVSFSKKSTNKLPNEMESRLKLEILQLVWVKCR